MNHLGMILCCKSASDCRSHLLALSEFSFSKSMQSLITGLAIHLNRNLRLFLLDLEALAIVLVAVTVL